jgi:hypothetical protein
MKVVLMWIINDFSTYEMVSSWSTYVKLACPYYMKNNKVFMLINDGKTSFFDCFLLTSHKYKKNIKDFFVSRVERDVAPSFLLGEELYDMVSEYDDIVFDFQSGKQKFCGFGLTHNWVKRSIF